MALNHMEPISPPRHAWRSAASAAILWIVGCTLSVFGIFAAIGDHSSFVFVILGFGIGIAGALSHGALLFIPHFKQLSLVKQTLLVWVGTMLLLLLVPSVLSPALNLNDSSIRDWRAIILIFAAGPSLVPAIAFTWLVHRGVDRATA